MTTAPIPARVEPSLDGRVLRFIALAPIATDGSVEVDLVGPCDELPREPRVVRVYSEMGDEIWSAPSLTIGWPAIAPRDHWRVTLILRHEAAAE